VNHDRVVNMNDFTVIRNNFRNSCSSPSWCNNADVNHDGKVNIRDLIKVARKWGFSY
jgi:hypothetical protein